MTKKKNSSKSKKKGRKSADIFEDISAGDYGFSATLPSNSFFKTDPYNKLSQSSQQNKNSSSGTWGFSSDFFKKMSMTAPAATNTTNTTNTTTITAGTAKNVNIEPRKASQNENLYNYNVNASDNYSDTYLSDESDLNFNSKSSFGTMLYSTEASKDNIVHNNNNQSNSSLSDSEDRFRNVNFGVTSTQYDSSSSDEDILRNVYTATELEDQEKKPQIAINPVKSYSRKDEINVPVSITVTGYNMSDSINSDKLSAATFVSDDYLSNRVSEDFSDNRISEDYSIQSSMSKVSSIPEEIDDIEEEIEETYDEEIIEEDSATRGSADSLQNITENFEEFDTFEEDSVPEIKQQETTNTTSIIEEEYKDEFEDEFEDFVDDFEESFETPTVTKKQSPRIKQNPKASEAQLVKEESKVIVTPIEPVLGKPKLQKESAPVLTPVTPIVPEIKVETKLPVVLEQTIKKEIVSTKEEQVVKAIAPPPSAVTVDSGVFAQIMQQQLQILAQLQIQQSQIIEQVKEQKVEQRITTPATVEVPIQVQSKESLDVQTQTSQITIEFAPSPTTTTTTTENTNTQTPFVLNSVASNMSVDPSEIPQIASFNIHNYTINDYFKRELNSIHTGLKMNQQRMMAIFNEPPATKSRYTTLEQTHRFIAQHRPKPLSLAEASKIVQYREQYQI
jgi:hypothetical protein